MSYLRCVFFVLFVTALGCRDGGINLPTAEVSGVVTYRGKALKGGGIVFVHPSGQAAGADINPDGTFRLTAYQGKNEVGVVYFPPEATARKPQGGIPMLPNRKSLVPDRYADPGTSGLTFEVKPGDNQAKFDLVD